MERRALVVGLGIAGMAAAIGLRQAGWTPVVVERAAARRRGGYFVGLMPDGRRAAEELGVARHLHVRNPPDEAQAWELDRQGGRAPGLGFLDQPGRPAAVLRGDIEEALWRTLAEGRHPPDVRFATTCTAIDDDGDRAEVLLDHAGHRYRETFDLVVGADGLRSGVRRAVFGDGHLTRWGAMICAFELPDQVPAFHPQDSVVSARPGRAAWVFAFADRPPTALLTWRTRDAGRPADRQAGVARVRDAFAGMDDAVVRHVLTGLEQAPEHLLDSVHQVRMPRWSSGRVVLVGDAAWCLTLYSGHGASTALRGGAALGRALREHPEDLGAALTTWEAGLRPAVRSHQRVARLKQQLFVPSGPVAAAARRGILRLGAASRARRSQSAA